MDLRVVGDGHDPVVVVHSGPGFSSEHAGDDLDPIPIRSARAWVAEFPNARLLELGGTEHCRYLEARDRFFPAVGAYLSAG